MLSLLFSHQRKHINDLLRNTESETSFKEIFNKYMDVLLSRPIGYNPKEELDFAYEETNKYLEELK